MSPNVYQQALKERGFVSHGDGTWHGPFGIIVPGTWNDISTTSLADGARQEVINQIDRTIAVKRRNYNAR